MKERPQYTEILTPLRSKIKIYKIASYDIETYDTKQQTNKFLQGGFIDTEGIYTTFKNTDIMIEYMQKHTDKDTLIYATRNSFDYMALFGKRKDMLKEKKLLRSGVLIYANYKGMKFYDTKAYTKASVSQLGKMLGIPKGEYEHKHKTDKLTKYQWQKLIRYNKRDCEITREFMIGLQKVINELGGQLKCTIGSTAMDLYRRKYLKEDIHKEFCKQFKDGETVKEFIYRSYHGGRTEIFKRGKNDTHKKVKIHYNYDYNSLYPSVMNTEYPYPSSAFIIEDRNGNIDIKNIIKYEGVSECDIECKYMYYPLLPHYKEHKLYFPIGRFRDVFTHIELRKFIELGGKIVRTYKTLSYTKTFTPFKEWVTELYKLRLRYLIENNIVYTEIIKLLLNNLYGKFGMHKVTDFQMFDFEDASIDITGSVYDEELGYGYMETPKDANQNYIIPIFSSYTTAKGRIKLYDQLVRLYGVMCDTDSVFSEVKIQTSLELGEMKLADICSGLNLVKPKHYAYYSEIKNLEIQKIKGIFLSNTKDDKKRISERKHQFNLSISEKPIEQLRFMQIKESIRRGKNFNAKANIKKIISLIENKRAWIVPYSKYMLQDSKPIKFEEF